eukprot:844576-Pyramimonas_sp.AAC.1
MYADGPSTVKELFQWQDWAYSRLECSETGPVRLLQLQRNAKLGFDAVSFYSGKGTDGTIMTHLNTLFKKKFSMDEA